MMEQTSNAAPGRVLFFSILTLALVILGSLFVYKWSAAFRTVARVQGFGAYRAPSELIPTAGLPLLAASTARTINYLGAVWPALVFGVLIAGLVRAFVSPEDVVKLLGSGVVRQQLVGGMVGMPLMLCSCCISPIFASVHARGTRLAPSLAIMLSSPSLNVAALILTFLLFPPEMAGTRALMALFAVFVLPVVIERVVHGQAPAKPANGAVVFPETPLPRNSIQVVQRWATASGRVASQTLPLIVLGAFLSGLFVGTFQGFGAKGFPINAVIAGVALFATLMALPTFFEIPFALLLMANGFPAGAVVATLFAGPALNLPSLFTLARASSKKAAALSFVGVWITATLGGIVFQLWMV